MKTKERVLQHLNSHCFYPLHQNTIHGFLVGVGIIANDEDLKFNSGCGNFQSFLDWFNGKSNFVQGQFYVCRNIKFNCNVVLCNEYAADLDSQYWNLYNVHEGNEDNYVILRHASNTEITNTIKLIEEQESKTFDYKEGLWVDVIIPNKNCFYTANDIVKGTYIFNDDKVMYFNNSNGVIGNKEKINKTTIKLATESEKRKLISFFEEKEQLTYNEKSKSWHKIIEINNNDFYVADGVLFGTYIFNDNKVMYLDDTTNGIIGSCSGFSKKTARVATIEEKQKLISFFEKEKGITYNTRSKEWVEFIIPDKHGFYSAAGASGSGLYIFNDDKIMYIYNSHGVISSSIGYYKEDVRIASKEEKQQLISLFEKERGITYDECLKEWINYNWKPKNKEEYFCVTGTGNVTLNINDSGIDNRLINYNNYFKTQELAEEASKAIKQLLLEIKHC